jgi:hypothetical protein
MFAANGVKNLFWVPVTLRGPLKIFSESIAEEHLLYYTSE